MDEAHTSAVCIAQSDFAQTWQWLAHHTMIGCLVILVALHACIRGLLREALGMSTGSDVIRGVGAVS